MITSISELYRALAMNLKYPVEAQEKSIEGKVTFNVIVDSNGKPTPISYPTKIDILLDEIIITALKNKNAETLQNDESKLLFKEVIGHFYKILPLIDIPEFKGKTVAFPVKFVLQ